MRTALLFLLVQLSLLMRGADYSGAEYEVLLPMADAPVAYSVDIFTEDAPGDSLLPFKYLIEWKSGDRSGYSAYFDGNFYRYGGKKPAEFHAVDNPELFVGEQSLMRKDMFFNIIPQIMGAEAARAEVAPGSSGTYFSEIKGVLAKKTTCRLDSLGRPVEVEIVSAPDTEAEQEVEVRWTYATDSLSINLATLRARHPRQFEAPLAAKDLRGHCLPGYMARTVNGDRFIYEAGADADGPVVLYLAEYPSADDVEILRSLSGNLPDGARLIAAFRSNRIADIREAVADLRLWSTLVSARAMFRELGVSEVPVIFFVNSDGVVADVLSLANNTPVPVVIQIAESLR